jgi:MEDS: MEthanogen/methylotroph, DcmR Sensory domain
VSLDDAIPDGAGQLSCPHLAMLVQSAAELHPALAAFYSLGASRNGWLLHRSLPGGLAADRAGLISAGLDVEALEAADRLALTEVPVTEPPERWAEPFLPLIDQRLGDGYDAVWWSRFPVGVSGSEFDVALDYDRAWDAAMHGRRAVSLCLYVVGTHGSEAGAAEQLAAMHDGVLRATPGGAELISGRAY